MNWLLKPMLLLQTMLEIIRQIVQVGHGWFLKSRFANQICKLVSILCWSRQSNIPLKQQDAEVSKMLY